MQEPARRLVAALIKPAPEQPEASALGILDAIIIARRRLRSEKLGIEPRPIRRDAFRSFGAQDVVQFFPPAEARRRPIRRQSQNFDRLRRIEQGERTRRRLARLRRGPCFGGDATAAGTAGLSRSGSWVSRWTKRSTRSRPKRVVRRSSNSLNSCSASCAAAPDKIALRRFEIFRARNGQTQGVEAETGIERIGQGVELFAKQPEQSFRVARRAQGSTRRRRTKPSARKNPASKTRPPCPRLSSRFAVSSIKSRKAVSMDSRMRQRLDEMPLDHAIGRRAQGIDAHVLAAEQPLDFPGKIAAETRGEKTRRPRRHIAERLQSGPPQGLRMLLIQLQRRQRQTRGGGFCLLGRKNAAGGKTRQRAGAIRRAGQSGPGGKSR